jgi:hypothetical protein
MKITIKSVEDGSQEVTGVISLIEKYEITCDFEDTNLDFIYRAKLLNKPVIVLVDGLSTELEVKSIQLFDTDNVEIVLTGLIAMEPVLSEEEQKIADRKKYEEERKQFEKERREFEKQKQQERMPKELADLFKHSIDRDIRRTFSNSEPSVFFTLGENAETFKKIARCQN